MKPDAKAPPPANPATWDCGQGNVCADYSHDMSVNFYICLVPVQCA